MRTFSSTQKYAIMSSHNTLVLPEHAFYTRMDKKQQEFFNWIAADEILTTYRPPLYSSISDESLTSFHKFYAHADELFKESYQEALNNYKEFASTLKTGENQEQGNMVAKRNSKFHQSLSHFDVENATFDKNFHALYEEAVTAETSNRLTPEEISAAILSNSLGTLSRLDFCRYSFEYLRFNASRLRGRAVVKILGEANPEQFDISTWLKTHIAARVRNYSNVNLEKRLALKRTDLVGLTTNEVTLEALKAKIDENHKDYLFNEPARIWERLEENDLQIVEYRYMGDNHRMITELSDAEYEHFVATLIKINELLKNLMIKTILINSKQFKEISTTIARVDAAHFFNQMISLMVSKKILNEGDCYFLAMDENVLVKAEFVRITLKKFSDNYLSSWLSLDTSHKEETGEDYSSGKAQKQIEEIYEHIKTIYDQGTSPAKKILVDKIKAFIKNTSLKESVLKAISEELERFSELNEHDSDFQNTKNYLELILKLPFGKHSKDSTEIAKAKKILNDSHFGMEEVKERILQFLAMGKLKGTFISSKILCLVGSPGVGKTSIAKAIAECLGRRFVRISMGGENDVSVIKGHRRTYIGAYPGKIVNALKMAGTENPVILLDEIDKLGRHSHRGNVQDVLLEILDPSQNHAFYDHYLDLPTDLSKVLFLCSANILDGSTISAPLLDRLEVIEVSGYTKTEKEQIFYNHLLPKLMNKVGLEKCGIKVNFSKEVVDKLIDDYAREPGVRNLEKKTQTILEKVVFEFVEKNPDLDAYHLRLNRYRELQKKLELIATDSSKELSAEEHQAIEKEKESLKDLPVVYDLDSETVKKHLGPKIFNSATIFHSNEDLIGFAFGLGYNSYGGSVLSIEVLELPSIEAGSTEGHEFPHLGNIFIQDQPFVQVNGEQQPDVDPKTEIPQVIINEEQTERISEKATVKEIPINSNKHDGSLTITGSLGDVMKESVEIGYSFAKHYVYRIDRKNQYLEAKNLHIHFPEGASKKDGPSAGITIVTALISSALQKPYNPDFAMTGEISLNGRVLKIGGLREKILAAKREGIKNIILPLANKADIDELKDYVKEGMKFHMVQHYDEVYRLIFSK